MDFLSTAHHNPGQALMSLNVKILLLQVYIYNCAIHECCESIVCIHKLIIRRNKIKYIYIN